MTTFNVSSVSQLTTALSKAQSGDVIQVASGTYSNVLLKNYNFAGNVTITSADPTKPAVFTDFVLKSSSGITLKGMEFSNPVPGKDFAFQIQTSSNVTLDHMKVHGPNNMGSGQEVGLMMVRGTTNVTVKDSEFYDGIHGISMLDNNGLKIANNYIHDLRTDGLRGGGNSNLLVTQNTFTDFHPAAGDHPDAMQLWTNNTTASATNITFSDNLVVRGTGDPIQGIFMRDIVGNLPFKNLTITGNMIVGARYNGIAVEHVDGGNISGNTVAGYVGETSWMRADNSANLSVTNNNSTSFISQLQNSAGVNGNTQIASIMDLGIGVVSAWLSSHIGFSSHWGGTDTALMHYLGLDAANLAATTAARAVVVNITGTAGDDKLYTDGTSDSMVDAGAGNGVIFGNTTFNQTMKGGAGNDVYYVRSANTTVVENAGEGTDMVRASVDHTLSSDVENLFLEVGGLTGTGNTLNNSIVGSSGNDIAYGMDGNDLLRGNDGDDILWGGNGFDTLRGDNGIDKLYGEAGDDSLNGGADNDFLDGGIGNDLLMGGTGNDVMTGGAGCDTFRFYAADVATYSVDQITDFTSGQDKIDLKQIYPGGGRFSFIGTQGFHNVVGELHYTVVNGSAVVEGDINGDGKADFSIKLDNVTKLSAADFVI